MFKKIKLIIFITAINLFASVSFAFNLPANEIKVGDPVYIEDTDIEKHYAVFLPFEEPTDGQVCASFSGEEIEQNNNLKDYGTCFINDEGVFTIVEIEEPFSSSYEDLQFNEKIIQESKVTLVNNPGVVSSESIDISEDGKESTEAIITDLSSFIRDAQDEIKRILSGLVDTPESTEATSSAETASSSVLGAKSFNLPGLVRENYLIFVMIVLISVSTTILIILIKKTGKRK
jgi:hypothetical protein